MSINFEIPDIPLEKGSEFIEFTVTNENKLNTHKIDIKNSGSNFTPTEDEFLIKDSM